jgi:hypothetical protein
VSSDAFTEQEHAMSTRQIAQSPGEPSSADQARGKAQEAAGQAKEKAGSQLRSQVDRRSTDAGHRLGGYASDVRSVGEQLREQGKDQPASLPSRPPIAPSGSDATSQTATPIASSATSRTSDGAGPGR